MKGTYLLLAVAMAFPIEAVAEQPDRSRLIGSPIYSSDGAEVGTISDVRLHEGGRLSEVRIDAVARFGFGTRQVEIPGRAITIVRGAAVLALPKEAVELLPSIDGHATNADQQRGFTPSD
jgi:sporulation protein YlmC with PRC-barrel domain